MNSEIVLYVNKNNSLKTSDTYSDISSALEAASVLRRENKNSPIVIEIAPGTYAEKLVITTQYLTLKGTSGNATDTILTYDDYAQAIHEDGVKYGTFRSYSVFIDADNVTLVNLTIENSSGSGTKIGQAVALYADGDCLSFENCRLLGHQDTLFTAPLPPCAYEINGFRGPKEFAPRRDGRHFYKNCYICGDVDFIFGSATAYFENCEIFSLKRDSEICGYVTAPSTPEGKRFGYIFNNCRFTSNCPPESVYLGRPWRDFAKVVIMNSFIDSHIHREGWHDWNKPHAHATTFFAEYNNYGPGADTSNRASFAHVLDDEEAAEYEMFIKNNADKETLFKELGKK